LGWGETLYGRAALLRSRASGGAAAPPRHIIKKARWHRRQLENKEWKSGIFAIRTNTFETLSNWWTLSLIRAFLVRQSFSGGGWAFSRQTNSTAFP